MKFSSTPAYSMGLKPPPDKSATNDLGPGHYHRQYDNASAAVSIPKATRGDFFSATNPKVGPGAYETNRSTLNANGASFKGQVAALREK